LCYERQAAMQTWNAGGTLALAYPIYRRITFDFPDSKWAKFARGRLADPVFAQIIAKEKKARQIMLDNLKKIQ
jgi:hypothetical protein